MAQLEASDLFKDKLVLAARSGKHVCPEQLRKLGAKDVLLLEKSFTLEAKRNPTHVEKRYRRIPDVRKNNCDIAILHGTSAYALLEKREFAHLQHVLVPARMGWLAIRLGLLMYGKRKILMPAGKIRLRGKQGHTEYAVMKIGFNSRDQTRQYSPSELSPHETLTLLEGLDYVLLRGEDNIVNGTHQGDIDLLLAQSAVIELKSRFKQSIGTNSVDAYTDEGQEGHAYKSVPYFAPQLAKQMLKSASLSPEGIRRPSPLWQYLAFCYHLLFHDKCNPEASNQLTPESFTKPRYHKELQLLAKAAGQPCPQTLEDMEALLRSNKVFPSLDLIGFYSNKNDFLKKRYFDYSSVKPGLATIFIRDFGRGMDLVPDVRKRIQQHFEILAEGAIDDQNHDQILRGVRGGNWADPKAPGGHAEPIYWFVCWDDTPQPPSKRTRRKHPRVDNENIRLKDDMRRDFGDSGGKSLRVIHSSDNSLEAIDHLEQLDLKDHPEITARLAR